MIKVDSNVLDIDTTEPQTQQSTISKPAVILGCPTFPLSMDYMRSSKLDGLMYRWSNFYNAISSPEYDTIVIGPQNKSSDTVRYKKFYDRMHDTFQSLADSSAADGRINFHSFNYAVHSDEDNYSLIYPRDSFQIYGNQIFIPSERYRSYTEAILSNLGNLYPEIIVSRIGEGGAVVRSGNKVLLPETLKGLTHDINLLHETGYETHFIPMSSVDENTKLSRRMQANEHIDTEINIYSNASGLTLLACTYEYYERFMQEVNALQKNTSAELKVIEENEKFDLLYKGVNFIELPDGRIVIPRQCEKLISFFAGYLGENNIVQFQADRRTDICDSAGMRCKSNVIA